MSPINPDHLFGQSAALIAPTSAGALRQTDIRRSVSAAYYGLFHAVLTAAADEVIGVKLRGTPAWALCYRPVTHTWLKDICIEVQKSSMAPRFQAFRPDRGFGDAIAGVAAAFVDLQAKRYRADYDPLAPPSRPCRGRTRRRRDRPLATSCGPRPGCERRFSPCCFFRRAGADGDGKGGADAPPPHQTRVAVTPSSGLWFRVWNTTQ